GHADHRLLYCRVRWGAEEGIDHVHAATVRHEVRRRAPREDLACGRPIRIDDVLDPLASRPADGSALFSPLPRAQARWVVLDEDPESWVGDADVRSGLVSHADGPELFAPGCGALLGIDS